MKKAAVAILLMLVPAVFGFTFSQDRGSVTLYPGDSATISLKLKSDHYEKVSITPLSLTGWYTISDYVVELNGSETTVPFHISVPKTAKEANYLFRVKLENGTDSERLLWIIRVTKGEVNRLDLKGFHFPERLEPGETAEFRFDVENSGNTILYNIRVELVDTKGNLLRRQYVIDELRPGELYRVVDNVTVNGTARPETFTVRIAGIWNGQEMFSSERRTEISRVERLERKKWGNILFLGYETVERITNLGNAEVEYNYTRNVSAFQRLFLATNGRIVDGRVEWSGRLGVGESVELRHGWNVLPFLVYVSILAAAVFYLARKFASPSIRKDVRPGKEIRVFISVKNRSMGEIKDVVVKDNVIPLFKPFPASHGPKPKIRKTRDRFVVSWRIPRLLPGEERILEYRLKPVFGVKGRLDFGRAEMACRKDNVVLRARSNRVEKEVM